MFYKASILLLRHTDGTMHDVVKVSRVYTIGLSLFLNQDR